MSKQTIFISISQEDEKWLPVLRSHLQILRSGNVALDIWDSSQIPAGTNQALEVQKKVDGSALAILFLSANYLASPQQLDLELPLLLDKFSPPGTNSCFWVLISQCSYRSYPPLKNIRLMNPFNAIIDMSASTQAQFFKELTEQVQVILQGVSNVPKKQDQLNELIFSSIVSVSVFLTLSRPKVLTQGLSISNICEIAKFNTKKERGIVAKLLYQFKTFELVETERIEDLTYWKLLPEGIKWARKVEEAIRASLDYNGS